MNNVLAAFGAGNAKHIEPYKPDYFAQAVGMVIVEDVTLFGGFLGGRPQVGGVAIAEAKTTAVIASAVGNAERSAGTTAGTNVNNIVETVRKQGIGVKVNPRNAATAQEGNVTLSIGGDISVNIRIETYPLKGSAVPVRHANVDIYRTVRGKKTVVSKTHITQ
jgi:hypothetical protein